MNVMERPQCISRVFVFVIVIIIVIIVPGESARHNARLLDRRNRMIPRRGLGGGRDDIKPKVCFDLVGCFADPPPALSLKRPPEHPSVIQTRFLLYTRQKLETPEVIQYEDGLKSIEKSQFNATKKLKVIIHGYKGSGNDFGAILGAKTLLQLEDANVIILDWTKGAGTTYQAAVANTELVGRQLALVLLDAMNLGTKPEDVHVVGFSLGAHVAGCASEALKKKKKLLLGRITGLDPASPFFRHNVFRERSRKLDVTDARLVDVIHTDGSEVFTDGFGLLKPMGHVDFFPNGGREQPGCSDIKNSVIYSHFHEEILDRKIACSHLRAWQMFVESIRSQLPNECKFTAWPCSQGSRSYAQGTCFPLKADKWSQEMGYGADQGGLGVYYLATRAESPFCGEPLRAAVLTSQDAPRTSGTLFLRIKHPNSTTTFSIRCEIRRLAERSETRTIFYHIAAAEFKTVGENLESIEGSIWYQVDTDDPEEGASNVVPTLELDKMLIEDRKGNRWEFCRAKTTVGLVENSIVFHNRACVIN